MGIRDVSGIATAAVRDAANGAEFLNRAERVLGCKIELLSGQREARLSALGVISSIYKADGLVGDLGGGSLELTDVRDGECSPGVTLPLGGLSLMDLSERSPKKAAKIVREKLATVKALQGLPGRTFYAVGGTWRALARLHMRQRQYPMNVMHNYVIPSRDALEFASLVERIEADALLSIESVSAARRPLLAYGAAVLEEIIRQSNPKEIVVSALGVREGLIYSQLSLEEQAGDPLILSAREFNQLRSRAPDHGDELYAWTSRLMESTHLEEDGQDRRLRHAACLLSDISWRAHPDYRGVQAYDLVVNAAFIGVDHPSRAFLALAASYRHMSNGDLVSPQSRALSQPYNSIGREFSGRRCESPITFPQRCRGAAARPYGLREGSRDPNFAGGPRAAERRATSVAHAAVWSPVGPNRRSERPFEVWRRCALAMATAETFSRPEPSNASKRTEVSNEFFTGPARKLDITHLRQRSVSHALVPNRQPIFS